MSIVVSSCNVQFLILVTDFLVFCMRLSIENCNFTAKNIYYVILFSCISACKSLYYHRDCVKSILGLCVRYVYASVFVFIVHIFHSKIVLVAFWSSDIVQTEPVICGDFIARFFSFFVCWIVNDIWSCFQSLYIYLSGYLYSQTVCEKVF